MVTKRCNCLRRLPVALLALRTGEGLGGRSGQRHPQLANALAEQVLPGQDALVRRQPAKGVEPLLQLSQGGISRWPDQRVRATSAVKLIATLAAGKFIGVELSIPHLGISI